jgi:hypothetical protein
MLTTRYKPSEYRNWIRMSYRKHILVEGSDDKRLFIILLRELGVERSDIDIDSAEALTGFGNLGNRERVEEICRSVVGKAYAGKLVGFVDREYREFQFAPVVVDNINQHLVVERLVWSRGHSAENYFLEYDILEDPMLAFGVSDYAADALEVFEDCTPSAIRLGSCLSLAAEQAIRDGVIGSAKMIRGCLSTAVIAQVRPDIVLDRQAFHKELVSKQRASNQMAHKFLDLVDKYESHLSGCEVTTLRWLCHGHLGLSLMWTIYARCVIETSNQAGHGASVHEGQRVLRADESVRFNACAQAWAKKAASNQVDWPSDVLQLLGVATA